MGRRRERGGREGYPGACGALHGCSMRVCEGTSMRMGYRVISIGYRRFRSLIGGCLALMCPEVGGPKQSAEGRHSPFLSPALSKHRNHESASVHAILCFRRCALRPHLTLLWHLRGALVMQPSRAPLRTGRTSCTAVWGKARRAKSPRARGCTSAPAHLRRRASSREIASSRA